MQPSGCVSAEFDDGLLLSIGTGGPSERLRRSSSTGPRPVELGLAEALDHSADYVR